MLLSPVRLQAALNPLISSPSGSNAGPHTALLILPQGRLLFCITKYNESSSSSDDEMPNGSSDLTINDLSGRVASARITETTGASGNGDESSSTAIESSKDEDEEDDKDDDEEGDGEGDEEPYLDEPERVRLLCGLASQWEEDESPKVECELGRVLLVPIQLPRSSESTVLSSTSMTQNLPASKPMNPKYLVLVLNGTEETPWTALNEMAKIFKAKFSDMPK